VDCGVGAKSLTVIACCRVERRAFLCEAPKNSALLRNRATAQANVGQELLVCSGAHHEMLSAVDPLLA
jgi:hypothetical protein